MLSLIIEWIKGNSRAKNDYPDNKRSWPRSIIYKAKWYCSELSKKKGVGSLYAQGVKETIESRQTLCLFFLNKELQHGFKSQISWINIIRFTNQIIFFWIRFFRFCIRSRTIQNSGRFDGENTILWAFDYETYKCKLM